MTCESCIRFRANPLTGWFNLRCLDCCCRLIESTRPSVEQREVAFEAIARMPGAPSRRQIVATLAEQRKVKGVAAKSTPEGAKTPISGNNPMQTTEP